MWSHDAVCFIADCLNSAVTSTGSSADTYLTFFFSGFSMGRNTLCLGGFGQWRDRTSGQEVGSRWRFVEMTTIWPSVIFITDQLTGRWRLSQTPRHNKTYFNPRLHEDRYDLQRESPVIFLSPLFGFDKFWLGQRQILKYKNDLRERQTKDLQQLTSLHNVRRNIR